jgi:phosphoribosyl 1,2-cyclic phosphate phosphodiesterase
MIRAQLKQPDVTLITHEHGDHFLGLDDLLAFRRSMPTDAWKPIPVYATEQAWVGITVRFSYLLGSLLEKRIAEPLVPIEYPDCRITPFKTFHGPHAAGSVGYVIESLGALPEKLVYTSDFMSLPEEPDILTGADVLIIQSHWFNEPAHNRPFHMSFQRAIDYVRRWSPKSAYIVHISDGDYAPGDPCNNFMKKLAPLNPMTDPAGEPYPVPRCGEEWQAVAHRVATDYEITCPIIIPFDGMRVNTTAR